ncbi:hypothetical protein CLV98_10471 [Dyadobacter jejuensis]|uniref:Uncharacterized protein n=1 Tax=Dyadobacter jejuensis TaxID=1082580 RepID=A0A316AKC0_9BACT|nr:hypothetical protein [Dyadobacter jejuensis]PWJ58213.1 hypothetical protein CLV98_10471 [Dyadobacter jejuensis]
MKQLPIYILIALFFGTYAQAQEKYNRAKALSSEEIFIQKSPNNRIIAKPEQKYLVLDASPVLGSFHRYRYFPGDQIKFRMKNETIRFNETIAAISDSSISIAIINVAAGKMEYQEIPLKEIRLVKTSRKIPFVTAAAPILPFAGLLFIGADFFNPGIDNRRFTTDASAIAVGGGFMLAGFISYKLSFSSLKINGRNKLKVLETY